MSNASEKQVGGDHYKQMAIQPSEYIHRNGLSWCAGNAVKYITRHALKGGRQDIEKAIHYLELLLEWEYPEPSPQDASEPSPQHELRFQGYPSPRCILCMQQPCRCLPIG